MKKYIKRLWFAITFPIVVLCYLPKLRKETDFNHEVFFMAYHDIFTGEVDGEPWIYWREGV